MFRQTKRWIAYPLAWLLAMLVPMLVMLFADSSGPAAKVNQFRITSFDATYTAVPVASWLELHVQERITASFPNRRTNHGIERRLDAEYGTETLGLRDFTVTDGDGRKLPFRQRREDGDVILRIGDASDYVHGEVTYLISYTISHAMVQAPDRQEIYLDVNGTGWLQPFDRVSATVDVSRIADRLLGEQACYQGRAGSTTGCTIERRGDTFHAAVTDLGPRETMTIAIGFRPGTIPVTVPLPSRAGFGWTGLLAMPVLGLLGLAFALGMRRLRRSLGRIDEAPTRFEPPPGIPPIAAADFLGRPQTGAAAQLTDLVLSGMATLTSEGEAVATAAQDRGRLGPSESAELRGALTVQLNHPREIASGTLRTICTDLFGDGKPVSLDRVRHGDVAEATRQRRKLQEVLQLRGPVTMPGWLMGVGMVALVAWGWVQLVAGIPGLAWPFLGLGTLAVLLLVTAAHVYPRIGRLTARGREVRGKLAGLHQFLTMAEAGRISWLQNAVDAPRLSGPDDTASLVKLYEPLLPYAIIFGVERTWQQLLGALYEPLPQTGRPGRIPQHTAALSILSRSDQVPQLYDERQDRTSSWWETRPVWGDGWVAQTSEAIAQGWDGLRTSRDDDRGGGSWSSGGSSSSWSSSSSSGSSGGGSAGGGMGGGGGGGW